MLSLMPDSEDSVRCSLFARSIDLNPAGNAIGAQVVLTIETPLPWPRPVFEHPLLSSAESKMMTAFGPARVLASVNESAPTVDAIGVSSYWRSELGTVGADHSVSRDRLGELLGEIVETGESAPSFEVRRRLDPELVLICTQGSHDLCCGGEGMRFAMSANASELVRPDIVRVSHTGGHRFAPTALTLPNGRMWAFLCDEDLLAIQDRSVDTKDLAPKCRGWWGAEPGPSQLGEIAVWAEVGWDWDDAHDRLVSVGDSGLVQISGMGRRWEAEVIPGREVPTIACNKPGGLPTKPGQEWELVSLREY